VCDPDFYLSGFAGPLSAYDSADNLRGTFPFSVSAQAQYKQVFAGASNTIPNIHRVVIDGTFAQTLQALLLQSSDRDQHARYQQRLADTPYGRLPRSRR
jgi:hypothetical protein